ncbi:hypothetical protein NicSoilB11_26140 [Arthrobacter sp. NicSoilB11]|jgi:hypothetical protein|nr:hypothetical protein NicSoilB11_26140 [Arthrobacter sp. NicSoilB11]
MKDIIERLGERFGGSYSAQQTATYEDGCDGRRRYRSHDPVSRFVLQFRITRAGPLPEQEGHRKSYGSHPNGYGDYRQERPCDSSEGCCDCSHSNY